MRKVIFGINVTLDGCCDHTKGIADDEVHEYFTDRMREVDTLVYGRKTYQLMVPFWPDLAKSQSGPTNAVNEFATAFDAVKSIVVFSRSLDSAVDGDKTRIVRGDLQGEILKLKEQPGKNISTGGVDIPSQLIELGLVDEYHFIVHPIFAGAGRRFLDDTSLPDRRQLKLAESKTFKSGCVALHYVNP
jgi:dihydrofolate reductase